MKEANGNQLPRAREEGLVIQCLDDEVLVYDLERHKAHCLNQSAAFIWKHCDGQTSVAKMTKLLGNEFVTPVSEAFVWLALDRLGRANLLRKRVATPVVDPGLSRREAVARMGLGAALAVPMIVSIIAPTAVQGATALPPGACEAKTNTGDCQPGTGDKCGAVPCITIVGNCLGKCQCHGDDKKCHCDAQGNC